MIFAAIMDLWPWIGSLSFRSIRCIAVMAVSEGAFVVQLADSRIEDKGSCGAIGFAIAQDDERCEKWSLAAALNDCEMEAMGMLRFAHPAQNIFAMYQWVIFCFC